VRLDWSRLRFPDAAWRLRRLEPQDMRAVEGLAAVVAKEVEAFYKQQHKLTTLKQRMVRDLVAGRLDEARAELEAAGVRRAVVEDVLRLQQRIAHAAHVDRNLAVTVRLTGHLYNRKLLERTLDLVEAAQAVTRSVGEPVMGGQRDRPSSLVMEISGVPEEPAMARLLDAITAVFDQDRVEDAELAGLNRVEVLQEAHDVGELGRLMETLHTRRERVEQLEAELAGAERTLDELALMDSATVLEEARRRHPPHVYSGTSAAASETGLAMACAQREETAALNRVDPGEARGRTLADVYDGMGAAARREFLVSPYTARLPGGESLRDVIRRLEPFVVDEVERQRAPVVVVSHLSTLQVLYQYFVGVSSRQPFWKLDIPCGQVVQLVPRLFGFEERRIAVAGSAGEGTEAAAGWMHMVSHWEH